MRSLRLLLVALVTLGAGVSFAQTNLAACASNQLPYRANADYSAQGITPASACIQWSINAAPSGWSYHSYLEGACVIRNTSGAFTYTNIAKMCEPSPFHADPAQLNTLTAGKVKDYMDLWTLFLVAAVAVLCAKSIYNRFRIDHSHGS